MMSWKGRSKAAPPAESRVQAEFDTYQVRMGTETTDALAESPARPLYEEATLARNVAELRALLAADASPETRAAMDGELARGIASYRDAWFQRIDFPGQPLTTTSDRSWAYIDQGGLNTLGGRLTGEEASLLRPWPKWTYLKPLMPDLRGKSVLEIGCANGFFSFRFAEMGASAVTGVEAIGRQHESSVWAASLRGERNVRFVHGDALLDLTLPQHDVVFLSEVFNHFLSPAFGLLRLLQLARETLVLDTGIQTVGRHEVQLTTGWHNETKGLIYHSYLMSEGLLFDLLALMGVPPSRVRRYLAPPDHFHGVYVIDTRDLAENRKRINYPEYLRHALDLKFKTS